MPQTITIYQLIEICKVYDDVHGRFPESPLEGEAVCKFICEYLSPKIDG